MTNRDSGDSVSRLRVGGWLPSPEEATATQPLPAVPAGPQPDPVLAPDPEPVSRLEPVQVDRRRHGRWWFVVVPVAVLVLVVAVAWQFRTGGDPVLPALPQLSPQAALPEATGSARVSDGSPAPTSASPSGSTSSSPAAKRSATVSASASKAPTAHGGAVVGIGGRCLEAGRTWVELADCADRADQRWSAGGDGTVRASGRCLDVFFSGEANGTPVILYECHRTDAQQWQIRGDATWRNPQSNKCLSTVGGRSDPGTRLAVFDCTGAQNQRWILT